MRIQGARWEHICNNPLCWTNVNMYWVYCPWCGSKIDNEVVRSHDPRSSYEEEWDEVEAALDKMREAANRAAPPPDSFSRWFDSRRGP